MNPPSARAARVLATEIIEFLEGEECPESRLLAMCEVERLIEQRLQLKSQVKEVVVAGGDKRRPKLIFTRE